MAERLFFPAEQLEGSTYSRNSQRQGSETDYSCKVSHEHLVDDFEETARLKSKIISHPLFEHLLEAHVSCLCVALPMDCIHALESQLANKNRVAMKYLTLGKTDAPEVDCKEEIDEFMGNYLLALKSCKKHLEEHVAGPMTQAMDGLIDIQQAFQALTGVASINFASTRTMNEEFNDDLLHDIDEFSSGVNFSCQQEQSLLNHIRDELKLELKEEYFKSIASLRKEILRKRQVGKLHGDTNILKRWWNAHFNWPYPTEDEKKQMVEATGLDLKQINNWFINHRKRNWNARGIMTKDPCKNHQKISQKDY